MGSEDTNYELGNPVFLADILLTTVTFLLSVWLRNMLHDERAVELYSHIFLIPLILVFVLGFLTYFGGYREPRSNSMLGYSWAIIRTLILTVGILLSLLFFLKIEYISRFVIILFATGEFFVLLLIRFVVTMYYKEAIRSGTRVLRVLIVGTRSRALDLVAALQQQIVWGVNVVGLVDPDPQMLGETIQDIPVIGTVRNIHQCLKENVIDEVIVAIPRSLLEDAEPIVAACEEEGIKLRFMADIFNVQFANISLDQVQGIPLLTLEPVSQDRQQLFAKRLIDLSLTIVCLPVLIPLFAIIAIAIKIDSPGPFFLCSSG